MDKSVMEYKMTQAPVMAKKVRKEDLDMIADSINFNTSRRIEELRVAQRITKVEMGCYLGLSYPSIRARLSGEVPFQFNEVLRVANWWHLSLDELVGDIPINELSGGDEINE